METDDQQAAMRTLIRLMMEATGLDATSLARRAGMAPSTLTRFLNQPVKHLLTARTLAKLAKASGVPVPAGGPISAPPERELLAAFRSSDEQGKEMLLRLARAVRPTTSASQGSKSPDRPLASEIIDSPGEQEWVAFWRGLSDAERVEALRRLQVSVREPVR
jgi:transcriptional regulator with XRE-family HTH domain